MPIANSRSPPRPAGPALAHWNPQVTPQLDVGEHHVPDEALNAKLRSQGITARLVAPGSRIIKGQSIVVSTAGGEHRAIDLANAEWRSTFA